MAATPATIAQEHATEIVAAACLHLHCTPSDVRLVPEKSFAHPTDADTYGFLLIGHEVFLGVTARLVNGRLGDWKVMEME